MRYGIICLALILIGAGAQAQDLEKTLKGLGDQLKAPVPGSAKPESASPSIPALGNVSEADEIKIGQQIAGNLLGAAPLVDDPALQRYVNRVGRWVASQGERPGLPWTFGVIDSTDVNAFAVPGGYIFVTKGLYRILRDESELAGVLGHEVAHVVRGHHLKLIQQEKLVGAGADLLKQNLGERNDLVQRLIGSGAEIMARGLDKSAEFEADRMGVVLATRSGYESFGLPSVLQEIGRLSTDSGAVALLFKTHPHPDERLARLGEAMGTRFDGITDGKSLPDRLE
jgi:predicted Zn-dependent protease